MLLDLQNNSVTMKVMKTTYKWFYWHWFYRLLTKWSRIVSCNTIGNKLSDQSQSDQKSQLHFCVMRDKVINYKEINYCHSYCYLWQTKWWIQKQLQIMITDVPNGAKWWGTHNGTLKVEKRLYFMGSGLRIKGVVGACETSLVQLTENSHDETAGFGWKKQHLQK